MVSKKLATRLEKKREELIATQNRVAALKDEVMDIEQEVRLELIGQLEKQLHTKDLSDVESFIENVKPIMSKTPEADSMQSMTQTDGGF